MRRMGFTAIRALARISADTDARRRRMPGPLRPRTSPRDYAFFLEADAAFALAAGFFAAAFFAGAFALAAAFGAALAFAAVFGLAFAGAFLVAVLAVLAGIAMGTPLR